MCIHILWEKEGLLPGLTQIHGVSSVGFLYRGIIRDRAPIHLYHGSPRALRAMNLDVVSALHKLRPFITRVFRLLLLCTLLWGHLPFLQLLRWSFFLQVRIDTRTLVNGRKRMGRRKVGRGLGFRSFRQSCFLTLVIHQTP